eukprot:6024882-Alexandrium_andersonii.AAC.1
MHFSKSRASRAAHCHDGSPSAVRACTCVSWPRWGIPRPAHPFSFPSAASRLDAPLSQPFQGAGALECELRPGWDSCPNRLA